MDERRLPVSSDSSVRQDAGAATFAAPYVGGGFAAEWCRTSDVDSAITFVQRAAAYSVTSRGAQASMPWLSDLD